jgi:hypothetical protein
VASRPPAHALEDTNVRVHDAFDALFYFLSLLRALDPPECGHVWQLIRTAAAASVLDDSPVIPPSPAPGSCLAITPYGNVQTPPGNPVSSGTWSPCGSGPCSPAAAITEAVDNSPSMLQRARQQEMVKLRERVPFSRPSLLVPIWPHPLFALSHASTPIKIATTTTNKRCFQHKHHWLNTTAHAKPPRSSPGMFVTRCDHAQLLAQSQGSPAARSAELKPLEYGRASSKEENDAALAQLLGTSPGVRCLPRSRVQLCTADIPACGAQAMSLR